MGLNLNQVILAGHLTRDPEIRSLGADRMVAVFSIANNRRWKGADGVLHEEVSFIDCEAWARTAEMVGQYLTKGSACVVLGRLKQDSWTDKEGGKRSKLKVVVENVQFVGPKRDGAEGEGAESGDDASTTTGDPVAARSAPRTAVRPGAQRGAAAVLDEPPF